MQYHQNLCLPFAVDVVLCIAALPCWQGERENRTLFYFHEINLILAAICCFSLMLFSLTSFFFWLSLDLRRANGKFSVSRLCYDLCTIAKCMNDSIVVTIIHYSLFVPEKKNYAKLRKTPEMFPIFIEHSCTYRKTWEIEQHHQLTTGILQWQNREFKTKKIISKMLVHSVHDGGT